MKAYMRRFVSLILVIALIANLGLTAFAKGTDGEEKSAGEVFTLARETTWAEAGKQIAGMLGYIVEDAADIDLTAHSERIKGLSLEDDSIYLAILAEEGYLPEEPAKIDPDDAITADEYMQLMEIAFPIAVDSQEAVDSLNGVSEPGNIAILGDGLSVTTMLPERVAVAKAQQLSLTAVKASALSLNAGSSVDLSESEIERVHIRDTAVKEEVKPGEEVEPDVIYLHMDSGTQLPEVIVKSADEVIIEGSGALGVVRVQEAVGSLTVRATGSVINETEEPFEVTGPDAEVVELQPGEQVDFVLSKWLVSFVTEGTPVEVQEIAPGGMLDFSKAVTTLEGKIFTAWYEDADYTTPVSRLGTVDRQMTLYARFVEESEAAVVTFETFGGREVEKMVFAKGEYLLTKPVESLYTYKEGYSFGGWCVDEECTTGFGYTDPIEGSMTLYAMYSAYEQEVREDLGTVAEIELPDGAATIGLVLPEGMTAAQAKKNITVEVGTGLEAPEISVRETENGAELYCEAGFTPGSSFTLYVQNDVRFADYPEYIDTLTVSVFREQVEVVQFTDGLSYVLWDNVTGYTPVVNSGVEYTTDYSEDGTIHNVIEDHDAQSDVIPGKLIITGEVDFQPEQVVVFYDGEINRDEAPVDAWEGGDLAGYVLFAQIQAVETLADGTSQVTFVYADPEAYIEQMDVHTTEEVDLEENLTQEQITQIEKTIASQLASNDELKAQMLVAVMTSEDTQRMLDDKYGANAYSLAALIPYVSDPKLDIKVSVEGSTATAGIGVGITVSLYGPQGLMVTLSPYLYFEEQLTLEVNVDGGFLWLDMSVLFNTKTTVSLQLKATTGDDMDILDEAKNTLEEIVRADGTAIEGYDYQEAADTLMNTMQELIGAELEYQDLFAVPLLKYKYPFYGIIFFGVDVELVGQAGVVATFGVTVTAEYGQKIGFNYNFLKAKGGSYKEKLASEVTTEIYLIGKIGVRVGIGVTLSVSILHKVTVSITGSVYAYVELSGMFMYTYALSAGGGNYAGALYLEVGIDIEIELGLEVEVFIISYEKNWTLWSHRWPLYSKSVGMTMSVVQTSKLDELWEKSMKNADYKTSYPVPFIPMKTYDMLTAECTENQLLFENLQEGNVTASLTMENIVINGEEVSPDDPRIGVIYLGDGENGLLGVAYADEMAAAAQKVESYQCDIVLTYKNTNKSELIKNYRHVLPFSREFKIAVTTVNVEIALYDWCAHTWGIESAEWDNATLFEATFENAHVLGCPVEPTATVTIDLDAVLAVVQEKYPDIDVSSLSWFNPTLNQVNRTVQYSMPRVSNLCYMTPESETVRFDVFSTTMEYDMTFNLFASRYPGYTGEITYIIEAPEAPAGVVFTVSGSDTAETMTFAPVEGTENRWSLTTDRSSFNGSERAIMMSLNGGDAVVSGLTVTGREAESVVTLTLETLTSALTVESAEGIDSWEIVSPDSSELSAITPGEKVTLSAELLAGYEGLRLTSEPAGLEYTTDGNTATFTMPSHDVTVTLQGVRYYQANFLYNYGDLGTYQNVKVEKGESIRKPADPFVKGLTFAGWYDNADCEGEPFNFTRKMYGNITLYADWRVNVTVDLGGAEGQALYVADRRYEEIDGETVEIIDSSLVFPGDENEFSQFTYTTQKLGDTALEIILPNYDGYDFLGWYLTPDFSDEEPVEPTEYELTEGVTFYARWEKIAVLTYELNYGEQEEPYEMALEYVGLPVAHIPEDPQREHYEFLGWFRTEDGGEPNRVVLDSYVVEDTMTLYACWKPVEYAITYELNGGENAPANPVSHNIESGNLALYTPARTGYDFTGWDVSGIDALYSDSDGGIYIPAGSVGEITLTAKWEPTIYTISTTLIRGETAQPNPAEYTIESEDIVLVNPTADGYEFTGWTGTELDGKTMTVVIPAGSIGNREYTATWRPTDPIALIVYNALEAIPAEHTMNLSDFTGIEDIKTLAEDLIAADETCADYVDQLSVSVEQVYDPDQDGTSYLYTVKVTVTFTDDNGEETSDSKEVELTVLKNPVTLSAEPVYTLGGKYIPYGTSLADVELTGTATSNGAAVSGSFTWDDAAIVPVSANNGQKLYKVLFTPDDAANYSTADILIAVNTQIGLQLRLDVVPESIEYMGRKLDVNSSAECGFYVTDIATGIRIDGLTVSVTGAVLEQSRLTPGTANVWLTAVSGCQLSGASDLNLYAVVETTGAEYGDTVTITRATPVLSGTPQYSANVGSNLSSIAITGLSAKTAYQNNVDGSFAWESPSTRLSSVGSFTYNVVFTPSELSNYTTATIQVTVTASKRAVAVPTIISSAVYTGTAYDLNIPETDDYTVAVSGNLKDAGTYTITLTLKEPANCVWADGGEDTATRTLTFTIQKAKLSATIEDSFKVLGLGYGQQLVSGQSNTSLVYQTFSETTSGSITVMDIDGETAVTGYWEWYDDTMTNITLNASAEGQLNDFGDGYDVTARFVPSTISQEIYQKNYEELTNTFHVDVEQAHPYYTLEDTPGYLDMDVYQPSNGDLVNQLLNYSPVLDGEFQNPVTKEVLQGTIAWESPNTYPSKSGKYLVEFTPDANQGESWNYKPISVPVQVNVKHDINVTLQITGGGSYLHNQAGNSVNSVTFTVAPNMIVPNNTTPIVSVEFEVDLWNYSGSKQVISEIKIVDFTGGGLILDGFDWTVDDGSYAAADLLCGLKVNEHSFLSGANYTLETYSTQSDLTDEWNRGDLLVLITMKEGTGTSTTSYSGRSVSQSSYALLDRSTAVQSADAESVEADAELTVESTSVPTPGEIGDVVSIQPKQDAQQYDDLWVIPLEQDQQTVEFKWEASAAASEYLVYTLDEFGNPELITRTTDSSVSLPAADYEDGCITLYVGAVLEDGSVTWGEAQFQLIPFFEETDEPVEEPAEEPAEEPTEEPAEEPAEEPTEEPAEEPTEELTEEPTEEPAEVPAEELTEESADEPVSEPPVELPTEPTDEPMPEPSPEPTPEPVPEPAPEPVQEAQTAEEAA